MVPVLEGAGEKTLRQPAEGGGKLAQGRGPGPTHETFRGGGGATQVSLGLPYAWASYLGAVTKIRS